MKAFGSFWHCGVLPGIPPLGDPRSVRFTANGLEVNLQSCEFVRPAAALWCLVYSLLARKKGIPCTLVVPDDMGVCVYLKSLGLFDLPKEAGVNVDDRGVYRKDSAQLVLPLTRFSTETDVENLVNAAHERVKEAALGAENIRGVVSDVFAEIAINAVQHAESPIGDFGMIQFYGFEMGSRFVCAVADGGIGIRSSLERNPVLRPRIHYDWDALELAVEERVSGTGDPHRGIGLFGVAEEMRSRDRQMLIHSGLGFLDSIGANGKADRTRHPFPGTLVAATVPT